jgi:sRNA-binding regulator protein Hfq
MEESLMKRIQNIKELLALKQELPDEFIKYLEDEFLGLYEYLSNGEQLDEFVLESYQAMILLEEEEELQKLIGNPLDIEFIEEVILKSFTISRIGLFSIEDVQLCYALKNNQYNAINED